jgi:uncharacterized protein (DUF362 family)
MMIGFAGRTGMVFMFCMVFLIASITVCARNFSTATTGSEAPVNAPPEPNPVVGIAQGSESEYAQTTRKAIENTGGLGKIIKSGDTVLIKPNLGTSVPGRSGATTDYRMAAEIVTLARECGASRIIIAEASGSRDRRLFEATGMTTIDGVKFMDFNTFRVADCYYLTPANSLTGEYFYIPKIYMDADVVIDTPKMKNHYMTTVTLSLKNCSIGVPPTSLSGGGAALFQNRNCMTTGWIAPL